MHRLSLADWLVRLESLHPEEIELGLDRVGAVAARLGVDSLRSKIVTVAGTNGKGSTIAVLSTLLRAAGVSIGVSTSPHLLRFNERIRLDDREATDTEIVRAFETVDEVRGDIPLTYYEFATLAALLCFRDREPEVVILEIGLGGRLDASNLIDPDIAIITRIDLDHESWLGDNREDIGAEKAGILRPGIPFICADTEPPMSVLDRAGELGCRTWLLAGQDFAALQGYSLRPENIAAAREAARLLEVEVSDDDLRSLLPGAGPPGRLQQAQAAGHPVLLDVAHNPSAIENLAAFLQRESVEGRTLALFSALSDKKIHAMIRSCQGLFDAWWVTGLPGVGRAMPAGDIAKALCECGETAISEYEGPQEAWTDALDGMRPGDRLVVFGSFHTVAAILPMLGD